MRCLAGNAAFTLVVFAALISVCEDAGAASRAFIPEVEAFIDMLVEKHDFSPRQLRSWFSQAQTQSAVIRAITRPGTARPWHEYRARNITEARVRGGGEFWRRNAGALARASVEYGIPEEILVATIGVETSYGRNTGRYSAFDALVTLAFGYPPRADLFRAELEEYLLLARENRVSPLLYKGSYAGALGIAQFLPSSYRRYAVDFDGDGKRDLWNPTDAIGSVANYYRAWGWQPGQPVVVAAEQLNGPPGEEFQLFLERGLTPHTPVAVLRSAGVSPAVTLADDLLASLFGAETDTGMRYWLGFNNFYVITRYNRSINYALAVHELAQELSRARQPNSEAH